MAQIWVSKLDGMVEAWFIVAFADNTEGTTTLTSWNKMFQQVVKVFYDITKLSDLGHSSPYLN